MSEKGKIIQIDDYRPHLVIHEPDGKKIRVCPVALIENLIDGSVKLTDVAEWEPFIQGILAD